MVGAHTLTKTTTLKIRARILFGKIPIICQFLHGKLRSFSNWVWTVRWGFNQYTRIFTRKIPVFTVVQVFYSTWTCKSNPRKLGYTCCTQAWFDYILYKVRKHASRIFCCTIWLWLHITFSKTLNILLCHRLNIFEIYICMYSWWN